MSKLRNYCFTLHAETLPTLEFPEDDVRYAIWQTEKCRKQAASIIKATWSWRSRCVLWPLRICSPNSKARILSLGVVLEIKPATTAARRRPRLTDPGSTAPLVPADRGCHTDLLAVKEAIDSGATDLEIAEAHFGSYCRFHRAFTNYRRLKQTAKDWKTEVYVLYGPPGTGKSRYCQDNSRNAY